MAQATHKVRIDLVRHLSALKPKPRDVALVDVDDWLESRVRAGFTMPQTRNARLWFWRMVFNSNPADATASGNPRQVRYGVPLDKLPPVLKRELQDLLKWKQATFSPDRPKHGQHREVTALHLQRLFCGLFGYASAIRGCTGITSISELVRKEIVSGYVEWSINEREVMGESLRIQLGMIFASLRHHPVYASMDLAWFQRLAASLPMESESESRRRKALKYVEYDVLEAIPSRIRADRLKVKKDSKHESRLAMQELLVKWLITLPWRQLNIRKCRISGSNPNLFKSTISVFSDVTKPEWVVREEQSNPAAEFWQFRFSSKETKTGIEIHALVPRQLIGPLEEYLKEHRPRLLRGLDHGPLFVNRVGRPFSLGQMTDAISEATIRYGTKRVTPHRFRDIVAYAWLTAHPRDFLVLSKLLWHRNINTTIKIYGSRFNESSGVVAMESWLEEREAKSK